MRTAPFYCSYWRSKRIVDLVVALPLALLIFPLLFPFIALLIKLDSKGPVLFRQKRVGFRGRTFYCYKFRTMRINDQADALRAGNEDARITSFGRFLRNTCLDELPQFIHVLSGEMSVVGPRPHMLRDNREFSALICHYNFRHNLRPGITGLAQVKGYRGPATSFETILRRYEWDAFYVRNAGFRLDCRIMLKTGILMFKSIVHRNRPVLTDTARLITYQA